MIDHNILLQGQGIDAVGQMARGAIAGQQMNDITAQNALARFMAQSGGQVMAGQPQAMNALATFGVPGLQAAQATQNNLLGMDATRLNMDATRQSMAIDQQRLEMERAEARREAEQAARDMTAEQAKQAADALRQQYEALAIITDEGQWDRVRASVPGLENVPFAERDFVFAQLLGAGEVMDIRAAQADMAPENSAPAAFQTLEMRAQAAGLQPGSPEYQAFMASGGDVGEQVTVRDSAGNIVFQQGPAGNGGQRPIDPGSSDMMLQTIDGILTDPALPNATGLWSWLQAIPGTDARRFGGRANQLGGQAFLQAFQSLKGGGAITEIEGQRATQAIGRLDTAQRPEDYAAAVIELREIINVGRQRMGLPAIPLPEGAYGVAPTGAGAQTPPSQTGQIDIMTVPIQQLGAMTDEQLNALSDEELAALMQRLQSGN